MNGRGRGRDTTPRTGSRGLLREERLAGYPVQYLLSRLRGRRSRLIRNWRSLAQENAPLDFLASAQYEGFVRERTSEGMWRSLLQEYGWVFSQMEEKLRRTFAPYFLYAEMRTMFIALRMVEAEKARETSELLASSLLAGELKAHLAKEDVAQALDGLEAALTGFSPSFIGITEVLREKGLRAAERELTNRMIDALLAAPLHTILRQFFRRLIDARNILALYKSLRMGGGDPLAFHAGGTVAVERLQALLDQEDLFSVLPLVKQATGVALADPDATQIEVALYRGVTRFLAKEGRDPLGTALILDYLWRCSIEVTNLSVLLAGKDLEREAVAAELVF